MHLAITPDVETLLRARAEAEGLTVEQYIERIAREEQQAVDELEALALEGLSSGEPIAADNDQFWGERRMRLFARHGSSQK